MWKSKSFALAVAFYSVAWLPALGDAGAKVDTLITGLTNPCGVAIRPGGQGERFEILVADSGAGRVVRAWSNEPNSSADVITGFAVATFVDESTKAGPIALHFLDRNHLVVGANAGERGATLRVYELADEIEELSIDDAKQQVDFVGVVGPADEVGNHIYAMARTRANDHVADAIVFTAMRSDRTGILQRVAVTAGELGTPAMFALATSVSGSDFLVAVCVAPHGHVVASDAGEPDKRPDSKLAYYNPINGSQVLELATGLYDIVSLAYSPRTGSLYSADIAWKSPGDAGIYRIDDAGSPGQPACKAVKIADVAGPSAIAFGPDGALYVAAFGESGKDGGKDGVLLKLTGGL
jgi:hypothetical protein